jgi:hypothetical protein
MVIKTPHLRLRPLIESDMKAYFTVRADLR